MPIIQSQAPYYDDFDETKDFYQILFRPGFGVQARELTQLQTILQNQVQKFGEHVFKNGSQVTGGGFFTDQTQSIKLTTGSNTVALSSFGNTIAVGANSGMYFKVKKIIPATGSDPDTIIGSTISGGSGSFNVSNTTFLNTFANNETLTFFSSNGTVTVGTATTAAIANVNFDSLLVHQDTGVFYVDGYFTRMLANTVVAGKYSSNVNVIYGLTRSDTIVSSDDDSSLLDNATGASNFTAPGANRLQVKLNPTTISLDTYSTIANNVSGDNFFEQFRIVNGEIYTERPRPDYNNLNDVLARRTYEESGNYSLKNFRLINKITSANSANLFIEVSPGTAYIRGNRVQFYDSTELTINKARDTETNENYNISSYYGNYVKVNFLANGMFDIDTAQRVELHNCANTVDAVANSSGGSDTKIGTAHVRQIDYESGTGAANNTVYRLFLFKAEMDGANTFSDVKTIIAGNSFSNTTSAAANIVSGTGEFANGSTRIFEPNFNRLVFPIPFGEIQSVNEHTYTLRRVFENITFTNGVATISTASADEDFVGASGGDVPATLVRDLYQTIVKTTSGTFVKGEFIHLDTGSRSVNIPAVGAGSVGLATIDLNDATFNGTADIIATIELTDATFKTKTLVSNATVSFASGTVAGETYTLKKSDGYEIKAIYESPNTSVVANSTHTDVTSNYTFFNGQKDNFYDHATITHKLGVANTTGQINVVFDYFTHTGLGAFVVNSYPIAYPDINGFTSERTGEKVKLRNLIDFRPRRTDDTTNTDVTFDNSQIPHAFDSIDSTFSFFLRRVDKLFLTDSGEFTVKKGVPSFTNPVAPEDIPNSMNLGSVRLGPYTFGANDVSIFPTDNKRYTMRDIGKLEKRLSRVEYYTALSLLEKEIQQIQILDENSNELFKNGILVDSFKGFGVSDVLATDYDASVDITEQYARPPFAANAVNFTTTSVSGLVQTGDLITLPFTEEIFATNDLSSNTEFVNPFNVFSFNGTLKLSPDSDFWYEQNTLPIIGINREGKFDNYETIRTDSEWNNWISNWSGYDRVDFETFARGDQVIQRETNDTRFSTTREGIVATVAPNDVYALIDQKIINETVIQFMRPVEITYTLNGMSPNTELFCYFDGTLINNIVTPNAGSQGDNILTNKNGFANGVINIPKASNNYNFLTGEKRVIFSDSFVGWLGGRTFAEAEFNSQGYLETVQNDVVSAKRREVIRETATTSGGGTTSNRTSYRIINLPSDPTQTIATAVDTTPDFVTGGTIEEAAAEAGLSVSAFESVVNELDAIYAADSARQAINSVTDSNTSLDKGGAIYWAKEAQTKGIDFVKQAVTNGLALDNASSTVRAKSAGAVDPVAETFYVNEELFPNGMFMSSVDLYFSAKDDNNIPVSVEIRPTVNGYPSSESVVPLSTVYKNPDEVNISSDGTSATNFAFESPVYLEGGKEYAIVIKANSDLYKVFVARLGERDFTSGNTISKQPFVGVFFKSSNSSTWSPDQLTDLKFTLKYCSFSTGTGTVVFDNKAYNDAQDYHTVHVNSHEMLFRLGQDITYSARTRAKSGGALSSKSVQQNKNSYYDTERTINSASTDEIRLTATLINNSEFTSPVLDASRVSAYVIKNIVNNTTDITIPETTSTSGDAKGRYISRRVTLAEGFDATQLKAFIKVNRQPGTSVEVYYKAISSDDSGEFDTRPYIQMTRVDTGGDINTAGRFDFIEDEYSANSVAYTSSTGSHDSIRTFAIKVVFYSSNPAIVPKIKDLRVVALS